MRSEKTFGNIFLASATKFLRGFFPVRNFISLVIIIITKLLFYRINFRIFCFKIFKMPASSTFLLAPRAIAECPPFAMRSSHAKILRSPSRMSLLHRAEGLSVKVLDNSILKSALFCWQPYKSAVFCSLTAVCSAGYYLGSVSRFLGKHVLRLLLDGLSDSLWLQSIICQICPCRVDQKTVP